jgi:hypothetical protein
MNKPVKLQSIKRTDAHDRYLELQKQADHISQGCQDCIKNRPDQFGNHPFYIFAHKRELGQDERFSLFLERGTLTDLPTHRLIWQPRLTKPKMEDNSMLFKYYPQNDTIKVIWMLPARELWEQYTKGKLSENQVVCESIYDFKNNKAKMEEREDDDLSDKLIDSIYSSIKQSKGSK